MEKETFNKNKLNIYFKNKTVIVSIGIACIGLFLIVLGSGLSDDSTAKKGTALPTESEYNATFVNSIQQSLKQFVSQIEGVGEIDVLVTLETGVQYVYATEQKSSDDTTYSSSDNVSTKTSNETSIVVIDEGNGKAPVLLKRIEPTIMGVVIVCDGASDIKVTQAVTQTVTTICGIGSNRVTVTKKSK